MTQYFELTSAEIIARRAQPPANHVLYQYSGDIELAIRVAQATRRPLLLLGEPGCGKSTLARDVAVSLGYAYIEEVVTSRTTARELQWRFDHVRRLGDAPIDKDKVANLRHYVEPGALWWAINPETARRRGDDSGSSIAAAANPALVNRDSTTGTVLLLDEIDKADPDVPNDLLVALGEYRFDIAEPLTEVRPAANRELIVFLTSNGERDLPPAFLRRCIPLELKRPQPALLKTIIAAHCAADAAKTEQTAKLDALIDAVLGVLATPPASAKGLRAPGTAEAIDAVRACLAAKVSPPSADPAVAPDEWWATITRLTLWKQVEPARVQVEPK